MRIIKIMRICIGVGVVVNPLTVCFYIEYLGIRMGLGLKPLGEYGKVINQKTQKILNRKAQDIKFIRDLSGSCALVFMILHPFGIPFSIYCALESSYSLINYLLFYKKRVEMGEFDE
jgi:hypothetical protein